MKIVHNILQLCASVRFISLDLVTNFRHVERATRQILERCTGVRFISLDLFVNSRSVELATR